MNKKYAALFVDCDIILVPDLDEASMNRTQLTGGRLVGIAASMKVARLPGEFVKSKGADVRDMLKNSDGELLVRDAIDFAKEWAAAEVAHKPKIYLTFDEAQVAQDVVTALNNDSAETIYQRSGLLVHVATDPALLRGMDIPVEQLRIRQLPQPLLRERIASSVDLVTSVEEEDKRNRPAAWLSSLEMLLRDMKVLDGGFQIAVTH